MKRFRVRAREFPYYFTVLIYDSLKLLREEANKHDVEVGLLADNNDVFGVCHCYQKFRVKTDGTEEISNDVGIIRLCTKRLGAEVYTHELLHAALHIYRLESNGKANLGKTIDEREEKLSHIYGRIYRSFLLNMYKHKFW